MSIISHIVKDEKIVQYLISAKWLPLKMLYINYHTPLSSYHKKILVTSLHISLHICEYKHSRERCGIWYAAVAMLLCIAWSIGTCKYMLFHLLIVIPSCFSELKLETCANLCKCTPIQDNCKILKIIMWWQGILHPLPTTRNLYGTYM